MATVGAVTFTFLYGRIPAAQDAVELYDRPGLDGHGARKLGKRSPPATLRGVTFETSINNAGAQLVAAQALAGTIVTVVDDFGVSTSNVLIEDVRQASDPRKTVLEAGSTKYRVEIELVGRKL